MKTFNTYFVAICLSLFLISCSSNSGSEGDGGSNGKSVNSNIKTANEFEAFVVNNLYNLNAGEIEGAIDKMIDPSLGVYLVYKPGALPNAQKHASSAELKKTQAYIFETFGDISAQPKQGELPFYDCEAWDKEGAFYKEVKNHSLLTNTINQMMEMLETEFPDEEKAAVEKVDASVSRVMVLTDAQLELGFGQVNGAWKLLYINIAEFDCGA